MVRDFRDFAPDVVLDMIAFTELDGKMLVDLFRGMARCVVNISSGDVRVYNVAEGENLTEVEWVGRIVQAPGWRGEIVRY
jgi:hypothetical protein